MKKTKTDELKENILEIEKLIEEVDFKSNPLERDILKRYQDEGTNLENEKNLSEIFKINLSTLHRKSKYLASQTMNSMLRFISDENFLQEIYVKNRLEIDKLILSKTIFLLQTSEYSMIKLLEQIDSGDLSPRNFEVLSFLQKAQIDISKYLIQMNLVMENYYKMNYIDYQKRKQSQLQGKSQINLLENPTQEIGTINPTLNNTSEYNEVIDHKTLLENLRKIND